MSADADEFAPANWAALPTGWNTIRTDTGVTATSTAIGDTSAVAGDVGKYISGGSIPVGATITAVTPGTGYSISVAATTTASGVTFVVSQLPVVTAGASCSVLGAYAIDGEEPLQCQQVASGVRGRWCYH